jgi:hypothetical protein
MIVGEMNATPQGELQSIEVKINKNGNQHEKTCYKLGNIAFFSQSPQLY